MVLLQRGERQVSQYRLADPVVVRLNLILVAGAGAADEPSGPQDRDRHTLIPAKCAGAESVPLAERPTRDGHDLEQPPRRRRQLAYAFPDYFIQFDLRC